MTGNKFNRMEFAGAFGDLGTLIPFLLVYINVAKLDPTGLLFCFGVANIIVGSYYKTPIPVQPMKGIGALAATRAGQLSSGTFWGAGFFTGLIWLVLSFTGATQKLAKLIKQPVVKGIVLGLGLSFLTQGLKSMYGYYLIAGFGLVIFYLFRANKNVPVILILLTFGVGVTAFQNPKLFTALADIRPHLNLPDFSFKPFSFHEFLLGTLYLAIPQLPITIGNAVFGITDENNRLFPDRPVTERKVSTSTGLINSIAPFFGGIPMCHGAGGMAGHVRFGAKTGGATVILGSFLLVLALFFADSVTLVFQVIPQAILGIIISLAGWELVKSSFRFEKSKEDYALMLVTAAISWFNAGIGLGVGFVLSKVLEWVKVNKAKENYPA